jgi:type II secretory pathway component PulJ
MRSEEKFSGKGFSLVEILFAIFVGMVLMGAAYLAMNSGQQASAGIERKVAAQQDVRASLQTMGLELSMASYNPNYITGIWHDLPQPGQLVSCASGNQTNRGIRKPTPTSIIVEMDVGESGSVGDQKGEIVLYEYDKDNQYISRQTANCGNNLGYGIPFLGSNPNASPPKPRTVRVINNNLEDPSRNIVNGRNDVAVFRYYNGIGAGGELFPDINPDDIPNIRRIDIPPLYPRE